VDDYAPVVAGLERDIDQVEATVFSGAAAPTERIYALRREATGFYRAVHPLLGVTGSVERMVDKKLRHYLRDVRDHLLLVDEEVAAQRDLLGAILEANMAVISVDQTNVSVQQNATVEQLTVLATVFLPLTFVTLGLGGLSLMGLPPSGGFSAKWLMLRASVASGQWIWSAPVLVGGLLAAGYVYRILTPALGDGEITLKSPPQRGREVIALALVLIALALGFMPPGFFDFIEIGRPLAAGRPA